MALFDQTNDEKSHGRWDQERRQWEERALDAANDLMHHTGGAAAVVQSRVGTGKLLAIGTREEILSLLGLEPAGTIDRPCDPAWYARLECKPDTQLAKGETIYRVKVGHENQPG